MKDAPTESTEDAFLSVRIEFAGVFQVARAHAALLGREVGRGPAARCPGALTFRRIQPWNLSPCVRPLNGLLCVCVRTVLSWPQAGALWPEAVLPAAQYRMPIESIDVFVWMGWDTDKTDIDCESQPSPALS